MVKVKDLIKYLYNFNPDAEIMDDLNILWHLKSKCGTKKDADRIWLCKKKQIKSYLPEPDKNLRHLESLCGNYKK